MSNVAIRAQNLSKQYRIGESQPQYRTIRESITDVMVAPLRRLKKGQPATIWALKDLSFEVSHSEVIGIIGRNGAGKSTLLKILSRITHPTEGRAEIHGRVGSLLEVGTGFHPELTGRDNIYLNGAILGMKRTEIQRKFDEIVDFAEIEKFLDTPVKRYSSGMYVRLAFAVAAHLEPEILLVDEVLAVGDNRFQRKCLDKMQDVGRQGRTVIFVSHNMNAITRLCQQAILLDEGRITHKGPSQQVVSTYLRSGLGTSAAREWSDISRAPGNHIVRLCSVRVRNEAGNISDTIDIRESTRIEIVYYNHPNKRSPYANIQLLNENNVCLFASGDFTNQDWRHSPRDFSGYVTSTCTIPGNFLAEGQMRVLVALTTHNPNEVIAIERDAVSFTVVDHSQGDGARGEYAKAFPGVVRPLLDWEINIEGDQITALSLDEERGKF